MKITSARLRARTLAVTATVAVVAGMVSTQPASGVGSATNYPNIVNAVPAAFTPNITNGTVFAITQVGNQVIVGGSFTAVQNHGSSTTLTRTYVLAFDASTGAVSTTFNPTLAGSVQAVLPGPVPNTVYVGGTFATVNGVKSKGITLLSTTTGAIVSGFKPPALNGIVYSVALAGNRLYLAGSFTSANLIAHGGLATINATTGALDPFMNVQTAGHHNYNGHSGANGAVGPRAMAVNPAGTRAVVIGNFKTVDGVTHDQIVMLDLDGASAAVDPNWNTQQYTAPCASGAFDTYMTDVQYAADGTYFAVTVTGGGYGSRNTDNSLGLCDSASRWESTTTGQNVQPTWVDYTGNDTLWSVAIGGNAIYVGGHQRWLNNSNSSDNAGAGAVPRPGIAALDPLSGVPLAWNPGRNPRGSGAYAMFVGPGGVYVGSDTDFIGNNKYKHQKIAYFPLAGGLAPAATTTTSLPSNLYEVSPGASTNNTVTYRSVNGTTIGSTTTVPSTITWSTTRGAFMVGSTLFYGSSDNQTFSKTTFNGSSFTTPTVLDAYNDPAWVNVTTGSGQTYRGLKSGYYSEMSSITGAFYSNGKLFYTRSGSSSLFWRWFSPDSGILGSQPFSTSSPGFAAGNVAGMVLSGTTLYYANKNDGSLHSIAFNNGIASGPDTVFNSTNDWRARSLFLYGTASGPNMQPTASAKAPSCNGKVCSFNGSDSTDPDGTVVSYDWDFGDGSAHGTGQTTTHTYANAGSYSVSLIVKDNAGAFSPPWTGTATPTNTVSAVGFVGDSHFNGSTASPSVPVPAGVDAGDTELLFVTAATNGQTTTTPSGWTQIAQRTNAPLETTVFQHVAATGDPSSVTVPLTAAGRVDLHLVAYSGVATGSPVLASAGDSNTATHVAPAVSVATAGSWVLSYWSDRTSFASPTTWALPAGVTNRGTSSGTGGGHTDSQIADSGQPVATGTYPSQSATANEVGGKGDTVSIVLVPGT